MRFILLLSSILACVCAASLGAGDLPEPDAQQPYRATKSAPVKYDIDFRVVVTPPAGTKTLKVWVPIAQNDEGQTVADGEWSVFPDNLKPTFHTEKVFGNRFAYFEFHSPQGAQIIAHSFKATVWQLDWDVQPAKVLPVANWPPEFDPYRRAERGIVIDDRVKRLAPRPGGEGWARE